MKEGVRELANENQKLKVSIRRDNKINQLFQKRVSEGDIRALEYQKLMEIKLILEAERLEQEVLEWDGKLREVQEGQKENKVEVEDSLVDARVAYWEMLRQQGQDL